MEFVDICPHNIGPQFDVNKNYTKLHCCCNCSNYSNYDNNLMTLTATQMNCFVLLLRIGNFELEESPLGH